MIRRPPRSTLFPTRRSSDLRGRRLLPERVVRLGRRGHGRVRAAALLGPARPADERAADAGRGRGRRSEEHTSELQSRQYLVCRLLLEKKKKQKLMIDVRRMK